MMSGRCVDIAVSTHAQTDHATTKMFGLIQRIQCSCMLCRPRYVNKSGHTADCQYQRVIGNIALRDQLLAVFIVKCADGNDFACTVQPGQLSLLKYKTMPACLCCVLELMCMGIHAAGSDFVQ